MGKGKSDIINFYEKMPKKFLEKPDNPNFHLHKLALPFRMCVVAPSGTGKSNFIVNLIHLFSSGRIGSFASICIITRNKDEPLYNYLSEKCPNIIIKEGLENTPPLDKFDKEQSHLVIFDDLVLSKNLDIVSNWYIRCRKKNVSVCFLSQSYYKIPPIIRANCSYMVILKLGGNREINMILSTYGLGVTKEQLIKMYNYATQEKFSPLLIDLQESPENRFRKGFLEILDPKEFG
tara:strand:- start:775 stop:1476 length:702 start_codon:yes stop_codon:yes gene_type:complete